MSSNIFGERYLALPETKIRRYLKDIFWFFPLLKVPLGGWRITHRESKANPRLQRQPH